MNIAFAPTQLDLLCIIAAVLLLGAGVIIMLLRLSTDPAARRLPRPYRALRLIAALLIRLAQLSVAFTLLNLLAMSYLLMARSYGGFLTQIVEVFLIVSNPLYLLNLFAVGILVQLALAIALYGAGAYLRLQIERNEYLSRIAASVIARARQQPTPKV